MDECMPRRNFSSLQASARVMMYTMSTCVVLLLVASAHCATLLCMVLTMPGHEDAATAIAETWGALCVALIQ